MSGDVKITGAGSYDVAVHTVMFGAKKNRILDFAPYFRPFLQLIDH